MQEVKLKRALLFKALPIGQLDENRDEKACFRPSSTATIPRLNLKQSLCLDVLSPSAFHSRFFERGASVGALRCQGRVRSIFTGL
jgi:hypothetical protein